MPLTNIRAASCAVCGRWVASEQGYVEKADQGNLHAKTRWLVRCVTCAPAATVSGGASTTEALR